MRSDGDIQFSPVDVPAPPPDAAPEPSEPSWLDDFFLWLGDLLSPVADFTVGNWDVIFWVLVALGVALLLFAIVRLVNPASFRMPGRTVAQEEVLVDQHQALQLLDDADRLAAEGRFDEATHLLLQRSVGQIRELRPDLIEPSSTAREIAALPALPDKARHAFGTIAGRVEVSLFALTRLGAEDWQAARTAYSEFALGYSGVRA